VRIFATDPDYQRQGAMSIIIRHLLAEAKAVNLPVYLEGTPVGIPVYKYFGFEALESLQVWDGQDPTLMMIKHPE
jgi:predicted acetyltransferase